MKYADEIIKNATIKKVGYKNCIVPSKDIWFTDTLKNDNVMFKKNIYSNEAFDHYVQKKCGFSIY